jgi:hypothetical protein
MKLKVIKLMMLMSLVLAMGNATAASGIVAFEKIKSMAGVWKSANSTSDYGTTSYEIIADGSVVLERVGGMLTAFHMDGDKLMATHYCEAKNQPRFVAVEGEDSNTIQFKYLDMTNSKVEDPHIHGARFVFNEDGRVLQHWVWLENGVENGFDFELVRVK